MKGSIVRFDNIKETKNHDIYFYIFIILFFTVWTLMELVIYPIYSENRVLKNITKLIIWIMPTFLYITYIIKENIFTNLKLVGNYKKALKWTVIMGLTLTCYISLNIYITKGVLKFNYNGTINEFIAHVVIAGVVEEIVFRGFILQRMMKKFSFRISNLISSMLFVVVHFPKWFKSGDFNSIAILNQFCGVFILGLIFGWTYKKSNCLLTCMIIHALNNFLVIGFTS